MTTTSRWLREQPRETRRWVVDLVLELYDDGQSYAAIARRLDADGIPRLSGGHWWAELVAHLVRCELGDTTPTPMALRRARRGSPPTRARGLAESPERCPPGSQASAAWWSAPGDPSEAPGDVISNVVSDAAVQTVGFVFSAIGHFIVNFFSTLLRELGKVNQAYILGLVVAVVVVWVLLGGGS